MISVLLIILKIIGITLLVIIGLILFLLLLVLFVPVRYRFEGSYNEKFLCKGRITWLLHLISVKIDVEEKVVTSIRILGIPLSVFMKKKSVDKKQEAVVEQNKVHAPKSRQTDAKSKERMLSTEQSGLAKTETAEDTEPVEDVLHIENAADQTVSEEAVDQNFADKIATRVKAVVQKIREVIQKIKGIFDKIRNMLVTIKEKKETLQRYLAILRSDTAKAAFSLCKKRIFRMLKHIFPRKMRVNVTYGMEDPADTGYILAVYGMMPEFVGKRIFLHADFEQQVLKGDFYLKGGIRAGVLLYQVLGVILDKDCQKLYHIVKKEISNEHK